MQLLQVNGCIFYLIKFICQTLCLVNMFFNIFYIGSIVSLFILIVYQTSNIQIHGNYDKKSST